MGVFDSKKIIEVSSVVYNMAGEEANRPDFLKLTMFGAVMNKGNAFIGETVVNGYLGGPGMNQRSLFRWAVNNNYPGLPTYSISSASVDDPEVFRPFIPIPSSPAGLVLFIQKAGSANGDYEVWAKKFMNENFPSEVNTDWVAEYNLNDHTITIQRQSGDTVTFGADDYDSNGRFVFCDYYFVLPRDEGPIVSGTPTNGVLSGLPSTNGFTLTSTTNTGNIVYTQNQTRVVTKTYSNGDPGSTVTDYPQIVTNFNTVKTVMEKVAYNGGSGSSPETSETRTFRNVWEYREVFTSSSSSTVVNDLGVGLTETVVTNITGDFLRPIFDWRLDTQVTILGKIVGGNKVFIYKIGSGNVTLDALNTSISSVVNNEFFPFIPLRLNNRSIKETEYASIYEASKKLYKKATKSQKLTTLLSQVEENPDLDEIDYAYIQWGVPLNTKENEAKKYLYTFWKNLIPLHGLPSNYISTFTDSINAYNSAMIALNDWIEFHNHEDSALYGTTPPQIPSFGEPKVITLKFKTSDPNLQDFDNRISFSFIDEVTFTGVGKVGAVKGDYWLTTGSPITWDTYSVSNSISGSNSMSLINIFWQNDSNQYKRLRIYGALHENFIYGGKAVITSGSDALAKTDASGFLIPLHYPSLKKAGIVSATQLSTANTYIVFNSYKVFEKKWYESFFAMLFIIVAIVVLSAVIAPGVVSVASGVLGSNAAVGAALGLSGVGAVVAGAVANAIAAVLISTALTQASTSIFGQKWGALVGAILSFVVSFGMVNGFSNLSTIFQPQNILALSSALANGYQGYVKGSIEEMNDQLFQIGEGYKTEIDRIQDRLSELMGNDLAFDPMSFTDSVRGNGSRTGSYTPESLDEFIQRTTLTGSDIVDMTLSIINDFSDLSLTLPRT